MTRLGPYKDLVSNVKKKREEGRKRRKKWRKEERKIYNILTLINLEDPFGETQMCFVIKQQVEKCF